jgi:hypothetical protein
MATFYVNKERVDVGKSVPADTRGAADAFGVSAIDARRRC